MPHTQENAKFLAKQNKGRPAKIDSETTPTPNNIVTKLECIKIKFAYPLSSPTEMTFTKLGGFTQKDFIRVVHEGYKKIYAAESDPGYSSSESINRGKSEGPYGIWGHYLEDLYLEDWKEVTSGVFELEIGS